MEKTEIVQINADKISKVSGFSVEEVAIVKANIAKGVNDSELAYFLSVCKTVGLNPFIKQIWCYKDNKGNLLVFAGRDGFLAKAQTNPYFAGIRSSEVCENDEFSMDIANNIIKHTFGIAERGKVVGGYALAFRQKGEPTIEWAKFDRYYRGEKRDGTKIYSSPWNNTPEEMIKKVAETHALKKAFGISGIQSAYDFDVVDNIAIPLEEKAEVSDIEKAQMKIIEALDTYQGEDKKDIQEICKTKAQSGEFDMKFAENIAKQLTIEL